MRRNGFLKKAGVYAAAILLLNIVCLIVAHLGWMHSNYYGVVMVLAAGLFLLYYWMETFAHKHFQCKRMPFAAIVLISEFALSLFTSIFYCRLFGLSYKKFGNLRMNDAEWMLVDIICILLHVIVLRITIGVLRYIVRVMKPKDLF